MSDIEIVHDDQPGDPQVGRVVAGLVRHNDEHGEPEDWRRMAFFVRGPDQEIHGGLLGHTHWGWLYVSHLWVDEAVRGQGFGAELLRRSEVEALRRGCRAAHLDTFSFQARGFYESHGYQVFGSLADFPPGHTRYFMRKLRLG